MKFLVVRWVRRADNQGFSILSSMGDGIFFPFRAGKFDKIRTNFQSERFGNHPDGGTTRHKCAGTIFLCPKFFGISFAAPDFLRQYNQIHRCPFRIAIIKAHLAEGFFCADADCKLFSKDRRRKDTPIPWPKLPDSR